MLNRLSCQSTSALSHIIKKLKLNTMIKKEWYSPQIIVLNNSSIQDGNPTAAYYGEFYAVCAGTNTCVNTTSILSYTSSGANTSQVLCFGGGTVIPVCS